MLDRTETRLSYEEYSARRSVFDARVYELKQAGLSYKQLAADQQLQAAYDSLHPDVGFAWKPSAKVLSNAYARHCEREGIDSDGPTKVDQAVRDRAIHTLLDLGWLRADVAKAFGVNLKSVPR